jgi:uncharacterized protein
MYYAAITEMTQMLRNVAAFLKAGEKHAESLGFDVNNLLEARLAPNQFPLRRQLQIISDNAKFAAARLAGREAPSWADDEETYAQLEGRIAKTIAYLEGFEESEFEGAASRQITLGFMPGHYVLGDDYLVQFAQPNFFFHVATAYGLLRHNGVPLGKRDFIGFMNFKPLPDA